jgi:signal transduction histidine kinase
VSQDPLDHLCLTLDGPTGYWLPNGLIDASIPKCTEPVHRFGSVRIEVIDQGPGITDQGKHSLFQEGVQLNPNQLQSGQGEWS